MFCFKEERWRVLRGEPTVPEYIYYAPAALGDDLTIMFVVNVIHSFRAPIVAALRTHSPLPAPRPDDMS